MALDWLPIYPDLAPTDEALPVSIGPFYAANGLPQVQILARLWSSSQPTYPALHWRKRVRPLGGHVAPFTTAAAAPTPPLAWKSSYPDRLDRRRLSVAAMPAFFSVSRIVAPVDVRLDWQPDYPDLVRKLRVHASQQAALFWNGQATVPPPALSWAPVYPSRLARLESLRVQAAFFYYPLEIPDPPPPGLGFQTAVYPDQIWGKPALRTAAQVFYAANLDPIPNPPPPTELTWLSVYPDTVWGRAQQQPQIQLVGTLADSVLEVGLRWKPVYPDRLLPRAPRLAGGEVGAALSAFLIVVDFSLWQPVYPDVLTRRSSLVPDPTGGRLDPSAPEPPAPPVCVRLTDEFGDRPRFTDELGDHPRIIDEIGTPPTLSSEENC